MYFCNHDWNACGSYRNVTCSEAIASVHPFNILIIDKRKKKSHLEFHNLSACGVSVDFESFPLYILAVVTAQVSDHPH